MKVLASLQLANNCRKRRSVQVSKLFRGSQLQFLENICSEDDLSSKIFGTFVVKFLACLSPRIFEHLKNGIIIKGHLEFSGPFFLAEIFEKVSFDPLTVFASLDFQLGNPNR